MNLPPKQSPCHYPASRRCEDPSINLPPKQSPCHYPSSRRCEVASMNLPPKQSPCHYPHPVVARSLQWTSPRSNLRATIPHPVVARPLQWTSPRSNLRATIPYPVVAMSLLSPPPEATSVPLSTIRRCKVPSMNLPPKQSPCHYPHPVVARSLQWISPRSNLRANIPHPVVARSLQWTSPRSNLRVTILIPSLRGHFLETPSEAISVSLSSSRRCEVTSLKLPPKQSPCHYPHPVVARSLPWTSPRSNLRATIPHPVVARFLPWTSPRSNLRATIHIPSLRCHFNFFIFIMLFWVNIKNILK